MARHNKFTNIKHRKEAQDKKRGKAFAKIARDIRNAARHNQDPSSNPLLRTMIEKAREANMPKENVERALAKAAGKTSGQFQSFTFGAFGPGGIGIIIEGSTDNHNRTLAEIRHTLAIHGGNLADLHAVNWMFAVEQRGSERIWEPAQKMPVPAGSLTQWQELLDQLEESDDVDAVFHTAA
ncbi:MAG: transcriptional regulator [Parcubacteria group bacterium GW2011_GWA2_47_8]|nr:MAG: transcriptional regulator [Parcubacteria group bacterium GW2011_GWA2_47_8]